MRHTNWLLRPVVCPIRHYTDCKELCSQDHGGSHLLFISFGLLFGLCCVAIAPELGNLPALLACFFLMLWAYLLSGSGVRLLALGLLAGLVWGTASGYAYLADRLDPKLEAQTQLVTGRVVSLVHQRQGSLRFTMEPQSDQLPRRIRIDWFETEVRVEPGELWRLNLKLKAPRGTLNPGVTDYGALAVQQHLGAVAYVREDPGNVRLEPRSGLSLSALRSHGIRKVTQHLDGHPMAVFIRALIVGDRSGLKDTHWAVLSVTGTSHLFAISGLHIGIVAGWTFLLGKFLSVAIGSRLAFAPYQWGCVVSIIASFCYGALAGFSIPTQRALITIIVICLAMLMRRRPLSSQVLGLALLLIFALDPFAVLTVSFWLSFSAVFVIGFYLQHRADPYSSARRRFFGVQWAIFFGLLPVTLLLFGHVSVLSIITNLVLVPVFSIVVVPLSLLGVVLVMWVPSLGGLLLQLAAWVLEKIWMALGLIAEQSWALSYPGLPLWSLFLCAIVLFFWLLPRGWPGRGASALLLPLVFLVQSEDLSHDDFEVWIFDVGHGLSVLLRTDQGVMVYDVGNRWRSGSDSARQVLIPFLKQRGIRHIDLLVLSHGDLDHVGGAASLTRYATVKQMWIGRDRRLSQAYPNAQQCHGGKTYRLGGVQIQALYPPIDGDFEGNNGSCVVRIQSAAGSVLLPGDIEALGEVLTLDTDLRADLVVGPHHGSATSSRASWVNATGAQDVVFSAAYGNHWQFPRAEVVQRWLDLGASVWCTGTSGAILATFSVDLGGVLVQQRDLRRRFWHRQAKGLWGCR